MYVEFELPNSFPRFTKQILFYDFCFCEKITGLCRTITANLQSRQKHFRFGIARLLSNREFVSGGNVLYVRVKCFTECVFLQFGAFQ